MKERKKRRHGTKKKIKSETRNISKSFTLCSLVPVVLHRPGINSSNNVECRNFMSLWSEEQNGEWLEMKMREGEEKGMMEKEKRDEDEEQGHM